MLNSDILEKIGSGEITSRRQVYGLIGRSKRLRLWMDENHVLMPTRWDRQAIITRLRDFYEANGRMPVAMDDWSLAKRAQEHFGSWNEAVFQAFGTYNQRRYDHYSDDELLDFIRDYVRTYSRLPLREEFDGSRYPYFEVYTSRFGKGRWAEVLVLAGVEGTKHHAKHGYGKVHHHSGRIYLSRQELLIGKYLESQGFDFEQEVPYGGDTNYRFDFYIPEIDVYIEYYGIATDEYRQRIDAKRAAYGNRKVIEVFKHDNTVGKVASEVQRL